MCTLRGVWAAQGTLGSWPWSAPTFQWGPLTCRWVHPCFLEAVSPGHCLRGNICPLGSSGPRLALGGQGQASRGPQLSLWEPPVPTHPCLLWEGRVPSLWVGYTPGAWGPRDAGGSRGEPGDGGRGRHDVKVSQAAPGTASRGRLLQKAGSRARELRAVLGPGPEQAAWRASVPGCCHHVEAQPGTPVRERAPRPPLGPSPGQDASGPRLQV